MIVCLGWGSLIWDPRDLPVQGIWHEDGPSLPIEFARQSNDGRLTLVIELNSRPIPVLWAVMANCDLSKAVEQLRIREGTSSRKIGQWPNDSGNDYSTAIGEWASSKEIEGVVWTALGPKFAGVDDRVPTQSEAIQYLKGLTGESLDRAKEYVEKAPQQIDTVYRRALSIALDKFSAIT